MKKALAVLLVTSALLGAAVTHSQAEPPYHLTTVSWIVSTSDNWNVDDHFVTLVGHVTGVAGNGDYWFTDGTGTVRLDADDKELPIGAKIVVGGRIDQAYFGLGHLQVDVKNWHYVKKP